jgi:glycosyltransferase involved in cell wall biosynthesis
MKFSVIIPAHNEEGSIAAVIRALEQGLRYGYEIVVVDDHSTDKTAEAVTGLSAEFKNLRLVQNLDSPGFANALKTGFRNARTDIVIPVMADLCDDPDTINKMYEKSREGFDVVCGSRYIKGGRKLGGPPVKSFFSRFVGISLHFFTAIPTQDISNSFKLYRKKVIESIDIISSGFEISAEIPLKAYFLGYKITEIPTTWMHRKEGESKFEIFKHGSRYLKLYLWALWKKISKI